ncbi:hypothetical protein GQ61_01285 [Candidatus Nucleicultrix amoebiphila FS5]|uniref:Uncharacterized protein n=1 Tax=Candidatus Nucleicultrix amoebiphila FS5 TaxID=1414854 RepID=A0A1W6N350_9PROT|nr:hypothetical protein GQ61_01285 [Candidatus Nucleicultrix amoebiphila FS5]
MFIGNQTTSLRGPLAAAVHIAYLTGSRRFARDDKRGPCEAPWPRQSSPGPKTYFNYFQSLDQRLLFDETTLYVKQE